MEPSLGVIPFKNQNVNALYGGGTTPYDVDSACFNTDLNFEGDSRKVLKAFVDQIAKLERNNQISNVKGSSPSLGDASSESFLSDVCMPNLWNNF